METGRTPDPWERTLRRIADLERRFQVMERDLQVLCAGIEIATPYSTSTQSSVPESRTADR